VDRSQRPASLSDSPPASFAHVSAPTVTYPLSLHDALPIFNGERVDGHDFLATAFADGAAAAIVSRPVPDASGPLILVDDVGEGGDRKSTRLNSSHVSISYAVFCLKKKISMYDEGTELQ